MSADNEAKSDTFPFLLLGDRQQYKNLMIIYMFRSPVSHCEADRLWRFYEEGQWVFEKIKNNIPIIFGA